MAGDTLSWESSGIFTALFIAPLEYVKAGSHGPFTQFRKSDHVNISDRCPSDTWIRVFVQNMKEDDLLDS